MYDRVKRSKTQKIFEILERILLYVIISLCPSYNMKPSKNLYDGLFNVFKRLCIYVAETTTYHVPYTDPILLGERIAE
jgi:hypothetical protein